MTGGERRLAERLEQKLDYDYLLWYDVLLLEPSRCGRGGPEPTIIQLHPPREETEARAKHLANARKEHAKEIQCY